MYFRGRGSIGKSTQRNFWNGASVEGYLRAPVTAVAIGWSYEKASRFFNGWNLRVPGARHSIAKPTRSAGAGAGTSNPIRHIRSPRQSFIERPGLVSAVSNSLNPRSLLARLVPRTRRDSTTCPAYRPQCVPFGSIRVSGGAPDSSARDVGVAGPEGPRLARRHVVRVPPDAAGVVRQQVDRDRRLGGGRPHAVDVVARWDQDVEVARLECAMLDELERAVPFRVDLLVLRAEVEADEAPGEVVVDRRLRAGRDDEREERQRAVAGAIEEPLADAAAHPALGRGGSVGGRKPVGVGEKLREPGPDRLARVLRRGGAGDRRFDVGHERSHDRRVEDELGAHRLTGRTSIRPWPQTRPAVQRTRSCIRSSGGVTAKERGSGQLRAPPDGIAAQWRSANALRPGATVTVCLGRE